jgi:hypothetical protein
MNAKPRFLVCGVVRVDEAATGAFIDNRYCRVETVFCGFPVFGVENVADDGTEFRPVAPVPKIGSFALAKMFFTRFVLRHRKELLTVFLVKGANR